VNLSFGNENIIGVSVHKEIERTSPEGKTSAVHFLGFPFDHQKKPLFLSARQAVVAISHRDYRHTATVHESMLTRLQQLLMQTTEN